MTSFHFSQFGICTDWQTLWGPGTQVPPPGPDTSHRVWNDGPHDVWSPGCVLGTDPHPTVARRSVPAVPHVTCHLCAIWQCHMTLYFTLSVTMYVIKNLVYQPSLTVPELSTEGVAWWGGSVGGNHTRAHTHTARAPHADTRLCWPVMLKLQGRVAPRQGSNGLSGTCKASSRVYVTKPITLSARCYRTQLILVENKRLSTRRRGW